MGLPGRGEAAGTAAEREVPGRLTLQLPGQVCEARAGLPGLSRPPASLTWGRGPPLPAVGLTPGGGADAEGRAALVHVTPTRCCGGVALGSPGSLLTSPREKLSLSIVPEAEGSLDLRLSFPGNLCHPLVALLCPHCCHLQNTG